MSWCLRGLGFGVLGLSDWSLVSFYCAHISDAFTFKGVRDLNMLGSKLEWFQITLNAVAVRPPKPYNLL